MMSQMMPGNMSNVVHSLYSTVGHNNRNALVQCKRMAPYNEDLTWKQGFDQSSVTPGTWNRIRVDLKHSGDREMIINDMRLRFRLNLNKTTRTNVGNVFCARGTDLIRELRVKINEDTVFQCDGKDELSHLWLMNNHRLSGESEDVRHSFLTNYGVIPRGYSPSFYHSADTKSYYLDSGFTKYINGTDITVAELTQNGVEAHDGLPRLIYSDANGTGATPSTSPYYFTFDMSLNQLIGPIFTRLHQRRIEYIQIEIRFQPWVSATDTQDFLLFANNPLKSVIHQAYGGVAVNAAGAAAWADAVHPYSLATYDNMELVMFRSTFLDGVDGMTLPVTKMLSVLMHRYSRRQYKMDLSKPGGKLEIALKDFELRSNITRLYWCLDTHQLNTTDKANYYYPPGEPCKGYEQLCGVELVWKNDTVLDLDTFFKVYRHYVLAENKRYGLGDPHIQFQKLCPLALSTNKNANKEKERMYYTWDETPRPLPGYAPGDTVDLWTEHYEYPIYFVDFQMNILAGVPGAEIIQGLINDTNDYVIRLKRVLPDHDYEASPPAFRYSSLTEAKINVYIEYQTLVNLAAGSNQFNRASQTVTKQLNIQN